MAPVSGRSSSMGIGYALDWRIPSCF